MVPDCRTLPVASCMASKPMAQQYHCNVAAESHPHLSLTLCGFLRSLRQMQQLPLSLFICYKAGAGFINIHCGLLSFLQQMLIIILSGGRKSMRCRNREEGGGFYY